MHIPAYKQHILYLFFSKIFILYCHCLLLALLEVRNRIEAKKHELKLKDGAEAEGRSTDGIIVQPGEVDWLYGDQKQRNDPDIDNTDPEAPKASSQCHINVLDKEVILYYIAIALS